MAKKHNVSYFNNLTNQSFLVEQATWDKFNVYDKKLKLKAVAFYGMNQCVLWSFLTSSGIVSIEDTNLLKERFTANLHS